MAQEEKWAQLVSTTDVISDPIFISNDKFVMGRSKGADISLQGNKFVSGNHCYIERRKDGVVHLVDTSTNGTLLNLSTKLIQKTVELKHGDEFSLVYRKSEPEHNVSYIFQDIAKLREEEMDTTQEYSSSPPHGDTESATLDMNTLACEQTTAEPNVSPGQSGEAEAIVTRKPSLKRLRTTSADKPTELEAEKKKSKFDSDTPNKERDFAVKQQTVDDSAKESNTGQKEVQAKDKTDGGDKKQTGVEEKDALEETLVCCICQELLHNCVSLQPCLHSFCAGCYSDWMHRSSECPSCRLLVERVSKNHIVNNLVEAYLLSHPDKKRSQEDLDELDNKNKITGDMFKPPRPKKTLSEAIDEEEDDFEEESDECSDEDDVSDLSLTPVPPVVPAPVPLPLFGAFGVIRPPKTVCRQCPEYVGPVGKAVAAIGSAVSTVVGLVKGGETSTAADAGGGAGPSGTGAQGTAAKFTCPANQNHILCQCCLSPMPDRRAARAADDSIPPQQCTLCFRVFCNLYWGCQKGDCIGCIAKFRDLTFGKRCLTNLILDNAHESAIFQAHLEKENIGMQQLQEDCIDKLESGEYTYTDKLRGLKANTVVCYACGLRNFKDLAYQYRKGIPREQLTPEVRARPDCHWGRNCRTQRSKPHHAANFNHVCEQTKF